MKILMTGSHGFVGTNLIEALSDVHEIIRWDARQDQPLPEVDAVIHLAGLAHDTKHTTETDAYYKVNTILTQQLYDRFLESSAKKFIFFSSIKAQDGDTPYALSKKKAEDYILSRLNCHLDQTKCVERSLGCARDDKGRNVISTNVERSPGFDKKSVYILRPCMIHGKGVKGNLPLLFKVVKTGFPWPLAAFKNQRSYASMGNVSYVVSEIISKDVESGIYSLCDDEPVSTNDLIRIISDCLGIKVCLWRIPRRVMRACAKIGDVLRLPLNTERLGKLTENYVVDNSPIKQALGIAKMPIKAVEGLKSTINYMIENR